MTGASGFVGSAVAARLIRDGRVVYGMVRHAGQPTPTGVRPVVVHDIGNVGDWSQLWENVDAVVHCAARAHVLAEKSMDPLAEFRRVNRDPTLLLANGARAFGGRRLVFLSSIGVNGRKTEDRPFRHDDPPQPHSPYAVAKWEAEQGLTKIASDTGLDVVTIRPPLVLGRGAKGNIGFLASFLRKGLPLPLGRVTRNKRDLVSLDVLADLVSVVLDHPAAPGQTFLVSDGAALSTREIVERVAEFEGIRARFLPVPGYALDRCLSALGREELANQLLGNLQVDIAHTQGTLGWEPAPAPAG